jgi:hypothetical protein
VQQQKKRKKTLQCYSATRKKKQGAAKQGAAALFVELRAQRQAQRSSERCNAAPSDVAPSCSRFTV